MKSIERLKNENEKFKNENIELKKQLKSLKEENRKLKQQSKSIYTDEDTTRYRDMALTHSKKNRELTERVHKLEIDCKEKQSTINQLLMMCKVKTK